MTAPLWSDVPIAKHHDCKAFECVEPPLNEYLSRYALKNHKSNSSRTFVAQRDDAPSEVVGYYTLSPAQIAYARTPEVLRKGLAKYDAGAFRLARLAVDKKYEGQGIGAELLVLAGQRCQLVAEQVGGVFLLIDAKNERVASWYKKHGAVEATDDPLQLLLPLAMIPKVG